MRTKIFKLQNGRVSGHALRWATRALERGGLVVFPTETVYGIAVDPQNPSSLRKLLRLKRRPANKQMAVQVASSDKALRLVRSSATFSRLAKGFWPGPLTLVARKRIGRGKIGIRVPRHEFSQKLLKSYKRPLMVTSLNASGKPAIWRHREITRFATGQASAIFLQPKRPGGRPSTVCDVSEHKIRFMRKGPISEKKIMKAIEGYCQS